MEFHWCGYCYIVASGLHSFLYQPNCKTVSGDIFQGKQLPMMILQPKNRLPHGSTETLQRLCPWCCGNVMGPTKSNTLSQCEQKDVAAMLGQTISVLVWIHHLYVGYHHPDGLKWCICCRAINLTTLQQCWVIAPWNCQSFCTLSLDIIPHLIDTWSKCMADIRPKTASGLSYEAGFCDPVDTGLPMLDYEPYR